MGDPVSPSLVQTFYQAYAKRDVAAVLELVSDDIEWKFLGPIEIFPFCGHRRGKDAVIAHFTRRMPTLFSIRRTEPDDLIIDGNRAAMFSKVTAVEKGTDRIITFHCAHLITFHDGKVVSMRAVADTFGVIEQLQGVDIIVGPSAVAEQICQLVQL